LVNQEGFDMKRLLIGMLVVLASGLCLAPSTVIAQHKFVVMPLAEKKVGELPAGPLYWRIENFAALAEAQAAAGPWALVAESAGKVWLFTLGPPGGSTAGATLVAEVGPIARVVASQYLLRINEGTGPPGSMTPAHTHPGSESFYVLSGETSSHTSHGVTRIGAGHSATGLGADTPMQVSSSGSTDLLSLVMFVVDADKPFSSPAEVPRADKPGN
jgi:quercetin dioxygenase-like cupin family protein